MPKAENGNTKANSSMANFRIKMMQCISVEDIGIRVGFITGKNMEKECCMIYRLRRKSLGIGEWIKYVNLRLFRQCSIGNNLFLADIFTIFIDLLFS